MEKENWFNKSVEETVKKLNTNNTLGLTAEEVEKEKAKIRVKRAGKRQENAINCKILRTI